MATRLLVLNQGRNEIQTLGLDGSDTRTLVGGLDQYPDGIVVDQNNRHIYWTNMGPADSSAEGAPETFNARSGSLERVDFDGSNRTIVLPKGSFTTGKQLTADFAAGKLYWCDREGMAVLRCDLTGETLETLISTGGGGTGRTEEANHCVGIAIDSASGYLYWTQKGRPDGGEGRIFRAGVELPPGEAPDQRSDVVTLWSNLPEPIDLQLMPDRDGLIWTDRGSPPNGNSLNSARFGAAPTILARRFHEAIGVVTIGGTRHYVTDLSGGIRLVDTDLGRDDLIADLAGPLCGITMADF
jgi:hypothetical protein